jgi:hypothetical protein
MRENIRHGYVGVNHSIEKGEESTKPPPFKEEGFVRGKSDRIVQ